MPTGTVKWWNGEKGEGYAEQDGGGPDVYITDPSLKASGIRELVEGLRIYFKVKEGPKGLHAEDVEIS